MSWRSRQARMCARICMGLDPSEPFDRDTFRSWVRSIQQYWGRPREMRKSRRSAPHTAHGWRRSNRRWRARMDRLFPKSTPTPSQERP